MSLWTGRCVEFLICSSIFFVAAYLRISGGAIFEITGSHCTFVPVIYIYFQEGRYGQLLNTKQHRDSHVGRG